jgi:TolB-like protein/tetratricopeptide (TPR) repeat protein
MGVVWSAHDTRLGRTIAIKLIRKESTDPNAKSRLWREARAAASVSHPNVCHIYDVGEESGELFVAMELLEGEPLAGRIARGPLALTEAIDVALPVLEALGALHACGVVHRDLKPSNIFLTPHGIKLLDFGLARPNAGDVELTTPGTLVGTPRYMAPEQWIASDVGPHADLFACGAILFEMLTGKPAFHGETLHSVCHAIVHENPPALAGGPEVQAVDRVVHRSLAKRPSERYDSAAAMANDLRAARGAAANAVTLVSVVHAVTRLVVLPFRLLRPDPEIDFLGVSLADAITSSLCGLESLVVRSSRSAARFATDEPDVGRIGTELDVDAVLLGTLLRAGSKIRLATQLVDAKTATLIWSKTLQTEVDDIFDLQDQLTDRVIEGLAVPLTKRDERRLQQDVPATAHAYEMYLRATHVGVSLTSSSTLATARDLLRSCLTDDTKFAPAWARLGRVYRIMAKYGHGDGAENVRLAREAFAKAFELNPDLAIAHSYYTYFEIEELSDPVAAMLRLLGRVRARSMDPEIFAGLVAACRFAGLLDASIAAHHNAKRLDPNVRTSVHFSWFMKGEFANARDTDMDEVPLIRSLAIDALGDSRECERIVREFGRTVPGGHELHAIHSMEALFDGDAPRLIEEVERIRTSSFHDPEGIYVLARQLSKAGELDRALEVLRSVVEKNYLCHEAVMTDPWYAPLRERAAPILAISREKSAIAMEKFVAAGGNELLGVTRP